MTGFSFGALALEIEPYEGARITEEQWIAYHEIVSEELASTHRAYESHQLEVYSNESLRATIAFTIKGHQAHPAWVTRQVVFNDEGIFVKVVGYYAGDESAFAKLFTRYQVMAAETQREMQNL